MIDDIVRFFAIQRNIFGVCPCCGELFRLSDCSVYLRTKPTKDWMDILESEDNRLNLKEEKLDEIEEALRDKARVAGRRTARRAITRIDPIFAPRRLNADEAKVLFHPVDYVVFRGMKDPGTVREIVLLDRKAEGPANMIGSRCEFKTTVRWWKSDLRTKKGPDGRPRPFGRSRSRRKHPLKVLPS
jgi:hypothetical protein